VGRADGLATGTRQVRDEIARLNPLLVLPGGDYAYYDTDKRYGTLEATIDAWFNQTQPIAARSAMMPTYGNHEALLGEGYDNWARRFPTPGGLDGRRNYSFGVGDVHFVSIFAVANSTGVSAAQLTWIENDITAAKAAGKRWIVPYYHVSPFADGTYHSSNLALRRQLGPLFERLGVKLAISSHDQAYERTWPLRDIGASDTPTSSSTTCYGPQDGVTFVKVSAGGKLSNISRGFSPFAHSPAPHWTAFRDNTAHFFGRVRAFADGRLRFEAYAVTGDGSPPQVRDSFEYRLAGCGPPDTTPPPPPQASPAAGTYDGAQNVALSSEAGATIRYTLDGSTPTPTSTLYTGPIRVASSLTIAIAIDAAANRSDVAAHAYTINQPPPGASYAATVLATPGLVSHWRLDESSGTAAADAAGANGGTYVNGVLLGQSGALATDPLSTSARFDGSNDHVTVADSASLDTGDSFTLEAWVRRTSTSSTAIHRVLSKGDGAYTLGFTNNVLTLRRQAGGDIVRAKAPTTDLAAFQHIVATKDGAAARLYIDGVDVTDPASIPSPVPAIANTTAPLNIGRATNGTAYFPGFIDEPAVYDVALSAEEVQTHHRAGTG